MRCVKHVLSKAVCCLWGDEPFTIELCVLSKNYTPYIFSCILHKILKKDVETLEKVQRCFTKRIPGPKDLTYCQRLARLKLDSLELWRVHLDLILVFGLTDLKLSDFFLLYSDARSRGHPYKLFLPVCSSTTRHNYFTHWTAQTSNDLPEDSTNFSSLTLFKPSLSSNILARYCKIYYF